MLGHVIYMIIFQSSHLNQWKCFLGICNTLQVDWFGLYAV